MYFRRVFRFIKYLRLLSQVSGKEVTKTVKILKLQSNLTRLFQTYCLKFCFRISKFMHTQPMKILVLKLFLAEKVKQ